MRLVTVAHGTRHTTGNDVAREITRAAGERAGIAATAAYVELAEPLLAEVARPGDLVVPLLLSTGFHVRQDLPAACGDAILGPPLGPDPLLADTQVERLREAGATPGQPVVMVAAGSRDPLATRDLVHAADLLAQTWGGRVELATLSAHGRRIPDVVRPGVAVSAYLLAPGFFARRVRQESLSSGAAVVADVLGAHDLLVDLVVARAADLAAGRRTA